MNRPHFLSPSYIISRAVMILLIVITFFPFCMMINMSLKPTVMITTDFLGLPQTLFLDNFRKAFTFVFRPILNSLYICGISLFFIIVLVAMTGYSFGRLQFKGKNVFFALLMAVMMIPGTITIVPLYSIITKIHIINTYSALILPYISSQQIFGIILARTTFANMPDDIFEAAKIDGAGEFYTFVKIGLPLSVPVLITVGITSVVAMYNDYIWPTIALTGGDNMKTFCQIVFNNAAGNGTSDLGLIAAAFIIGTIPLLIVTVSCLKYYLAGITAGAVKG